MLSDLFAMGVTDCDNMLMLLGVSTKMTEKERDVVIPLMMRGFKASCGYFAFYVYFVTLWSLLLRFFHFSCMQYDLKAYLGHSGPQSTSVSTNYYHCISALS